MVFGDHKGLEKIVKPLISRCVIEALQFKFVLVDSSVQKFRNEEVIKKIANSSILIQCSENEGTGLPILEALGVGTIPITTRVGIADEVLSEELSKLIVNINPEAFFNQLILLEKIPPYLRAHCIRTFDAYISKISEESIDWKGGKLLVPKPSFRIGIKFYIRAKWYFRYLRAGFKNYL